MSWRGYKVTVTGLNTARAGSHLSFCRIPSRSSVCSWTDVEFQKVGLMLPDPNLANNNCHRLLPFLSCVIVINNYSDWVLSAKLPVEMWTKLILKTLKRMARDQIGNVTLQRFKLKMIHGTTCSAFLFCLLCKLKRPRSYWREIIRSSYLQIDTCNLPLQGSN